MTIVLLAIPLILMTILYGSVIKSLRSGIRMDIAAIEISGKFICTSYISCKYLSNLSLLQMETLTLTEIDPYHSKPKRP